MAGISQEVGNFSEQVWGVSMSVVRTDGKIRVVAVVDHTSYVAVGKLHWWTRGLVFVRAA